MKTSLALRLFTVTERYKSSSGYDKSLGLVLSRRGVGAASVQGFIMDVIRHVVWLPVCVFVFSVFLCVCVKESESERTRK